MTRPCKLTEGACLVGLYFTTDWQTAITLITLGVSMGGLAESGYQPLPADLSPQFAGAIAAFACIGAVGAVTNTFVASIVLGQSKTLKDWQNLFVISGVVDLLAVLAFDVMAQAEPQPSSQSSQGPSSHTASDGGTNQKTATKTASVAASPRAKGRTTLSRATYIQKKHCNHDGSLPDEILLEIFTYLDVVSLLQASQVCKRWYDVARDNALWQRIAQTYAPGGKTKTKAAVVTKTAGNSPSFANQWRDACIARCAAWRNEKALKLVNKMKISPFTGLPKYTDRALKETGITYQLSLVDGDGREQCCESSKVTLHKSSAGVVWHSLTFLPLGQVKRLRVLAVCPLFYNDQGAVVKGSPYQRSLLWEADLRLSEWTTEKHLVASEDQINLYRLPGDLLLATWKADGQIAFFAAGLHYNQLVQRCLLGTPAHSYEVPPHRVMPDDIDSSYGLHSYKATVELRTVHTSIWSQQFSGLHCPQPDSPQADLGFTLIRHDSVVDHTPLEKSLCLPWRTELFKGSVENMAWLDVTVLDEQGEVFFTVSSPVRAYRPSVQGSDFEYEECEHLCVMYKGERASVHLQIGKLSRGKAFMRSLELRIQTSAVNEWFATGYASPPDSKLTTSSSSGRRK
ncbi:hypothetical protein ACOMHN_007065 [Nucella lapillus]